MIWCRREILIGHCLLNLAFYVCLMRNRWSISLFFAHMCGKVGALLLMERLVLLHRMRKFSLSCQGMLPLVDLRKFDLVSFLNHFGRCGLKEIEESLIIRNDLYVLEEDNVLGASWVANSKIGNGFTLS